LASVLSGSKKLRQFPTTVQEGLAAEEEEESNFQFPFFIDRKIEIMHQYLY
jgi:hypothetical protein